MKQFFASLVLFLFVGAATAFACLPGGITFTTQAQIDAFTTDYPGCTHIEGDVTVSGADITNLDGLEGVTTIDGYLYIYNCPALTTIDGLNGLTSVHSFSATGNAALASVSGLNGFTSLAGGVGFFNNDALTTISGFNGLASVGGNVVIYYGNPDLESITGFTSLTTIDGYLILGGASLMDISGFSALTIVGIINNSTYVYISFSGLSDISPLANVTTPRWRIEGNGNLTDCDIQSICDHIAAEKPTDIIANGVGCDNENQVEQACMGPLPTTTYVVTNTNNSGSGSLRQAMLNANADPNPSVIEFNIDGGGAHTIDGNFPSAVLNSDVTVDGTTQPGYSGTPLIEILKTSGSFRVEGENVWIKGLAFNSTGISASSGTWSNLKVEDCSFTQVYAGVSAYDGADIQIINCDFDVISNGGNAVVSLQGITENTIPKGVLAYGNTFSISNYNSGDYPPYFFSLYQMQDLLIGNQDVAGANITIEDDAGFATTPAACVAMIECHGVVFDNLQLVKTGDAGEQGLLMNLCTNITVQNCTFENLNSSVAFWPCQDVQILNNTFTNCGKGEEVFLNIIISDLGSNLLPNGLLMSGNQFSDIGRGIGLSIEIEGGSIVVGSPVTPDANIILTEDDGHDDIQTDVIYCGYEVSFVGSYTVRDLDFTGTGIMEGTGLVFQYGTGLVENCRITNFEFGTALIATAGISVQCNLIYNNGTGVARNYSDGNDQVENNTFMNNLLAVDNTFSISQLTAENNYWGGGAPALNGPNGYAGDVDADPYLTTPPGCAPSLPTPEPEMALTGNSLPIPDGSTTPDAGNHTDFGIITSPLTRTFTIENTGPGDLTISNITSDNSTFSVAALTPVSPIASGNSATFDVTFTPTEPGLESATISIDNNDGDENPYTFVVKGIGQTIVSGTLIWEHDDVTGVGSATVALTGGQSGSVTTPAAGTYSFTIGSGTDFEITPTKTINKLNGVTVADATAIQKHVAGVIPITDPYKLVGADVNKSNSITTADVVVIVQALAGNPAALANFKTSWRFAPTAHTMNIPPWGFPEKIILNDVVGEVPDQNFYGIKTGDVVAVYANPANFGAGNPLVLNTQDRVLQSGEEVTVEFKAEQLEDLAAFQFALHFAPEKLQFVEIQSLGGLPLTANNFGTYNLAEGEIRVVWSQAEGLFLEEAAPVFQLKFNVVQSGGKLSEALQLDESVLPALAYTGALAESGVKLKFSETTSVGDPAAASGLQLFQNRPNPFKGQTTISFVIPQESEAQLRVYDVAGRVLAEKKAQYAAGRYEETFGLSGASGVLWYELVTSFGTLARKMVATEK